MPSHSENNLSFNRIAVWGPPASGKSYFSMKLAMKYHIEEIIHTDDYLKWDPINKWEYMEKEEFLNEIKPRLNMDKWVVEGNLGEHVTREEILNLADVVFILNPSYLKLFYRISTRTISRNSIFNLGTHTSENAVIEGHYKIIDQFQDIIESIKIVVGFKKSYIHHLIRIAQSTSNLHKIKIIM